MMGWGRFERFESLWVISIFLGIVIEKSYFVGRQAQLVDPKSNHQGEERVKFEI